VLVKNVPLMSVVQGCATSYVICKKSFWSLLLNLKIMHYGACQISPMLDWIIIFDMLD
jgi:hypothetical protein